MVKFAKVKIESDYDPAIFSSKINYFCIEQYGTFFFDKTDDVKRKPPSKMGGSFRRKVFASSRNFTEVN